MNDMIQTAGLEYSTQEFDIDQYLIEQNHLQIELLNKKGMKLRKPLWDGLMAS